MNASQVERTLCYSGNARTPVLAFSSWSVRRRGEDTEHRLGGTPDGGGVFEGGYKLDPRLKGVVVFFNVDKAPKTITPPDYAGSHLELHPILKNSIVDFVVKQARYDASTGTFTVPPRTTAVFLER
jgi:hypothetical protein